MQLNVTRLERVPGQPPVRRKKPHSKSRNGCVTCKLRRIKCDETQPACLNCSRSRRDCGGYSPPKTWIFDSESEPGSSGQWLSLSRLTPTSSGRADEQRALLFFSEKTTPLLAAFSQFTLHFWNSLLPQLTQSEAAVRHLSIALASRQEMCSCAPSDLLRLSRLRSEHYSAALRVLTRSDSPCSLVVVLMCCLLFVGYENFQDPAEQNADGLVHLAAGQKILDERARRGINRADPATPVIDAFIEPMYLWLELVSSMFNTPSSGQAGIVFPTNITCPRLPTHFSSLVVARRAFFEICRWRYHCDDSVPAFRHVRSLLLRWHRLLMGYHDSLSESATLEKMMVQALTAQYRLLFAGIVYSARSDFSGDSRFRPYRVDLSDPSRIVVDFTIPHRCLLILYDIGLEKVVTSNDTKLRLWPLAEVRELDDGRGLVRLTTQA